MAARTRQEVRRELETERERLGDAVKTLRSRAGTAGRKLSVAALGAAAVGIAARVFRGNSMKRKERARLPFLHRD
jgi:hypothetical protein